MIKILGFKRLVILLVLIGINAFVGAVTFGYLSPESLKSERDVRSMRSQNTALRADIERVQVELEQLAEQKGLFEKYREAGFFARQNRRQIEDILKSVQQFSGVTRAAASVNPAEIEENEEAAKANHNVLNSTIEIKIAAFSDVDILRYIFLLKRDFPGHVSVDEINIKRAGEVNGTVLRAIATGSGIPLVNAELVLSWRTMVPENDLEQERGN
ncbi:MAG: hypothetical protein CMH26_05190 [Micavibrio sp.]|nr:hypothetical protein [Micavibrio sp.]|tara:strand:+ start:712 stop:1353 length:642 start_codon:yes stop_codon:yes gene_type:complete